MNKSTYEVLIIIGVILVMFFAMILSAMTQNFKFMFIVPIIMGSIFIYFSIGTIKKVDYSKWKDGKGKVLCIKEEEFKRERGRLWYSQPYIIFEFMDENGNKHRGKSHHFDNKFREELEEKFKIGTEVQFKYKLHESTTFKNIFGTEPLASIYLIGEESKQSSPKLNLILIAMGAFFIFLGIVMLVKW